MTENAVPQPVLEEAPLYKAKSSGSFAAGILGGVIGAIIGAILWGIISVWIDMQIGWMAVGVGALVGLGVRFLGKGASIKFGIAGAILAFLGCVLGNVVMIYIVISREFGIPLWEVITTLTAGDIFEMLKELFNLIDILFYALALYAGFRFSYRKVKSD